MRCPICRKGTLIDFAFLIVCTRCEKAWRDFEFMDQVDESRVLPEWADEVRLASVGG